MNSLEMSFGSEVATLAGGIEVFSEIGKGTTASEPRNVYSGIEPGAC